MTRFCVWCKPEHALGEKCSQCGSDNLHKVFERFVCRNELCPHFLKTGLRHTFAAGEGGRTDGICTDARLRATREAVGV